jgi:hypothetical protein
VPEREPTGQKFPRVLCRRVEMSRKDGLPDGFLAGNGTVRVDVESFKVS